MSASVHELTPPLWCPEDSGAVRAPDPALKMTVCSGGALWVFGASLSWCLCNDAATTWPNSSILTPKFSVTVGPERGAIHLPRSRKPSCSIRRPPTSPRGGSFQIGTPMRHFLRNNNLCRKCQFFIVVETIRCCDDRTEIDALITIVCSDPTDCNALSRDCKSKLQAPRRAATGCQVRTPRGGVW